MPSRLVLGAVAALALAQGAMAQEVILGGDDPAASNGSWDSRCLSTGRQDGADCTTTMRVLQSGSGQLVGAATVRINGADKQPVLYITAPLGLSIPAGIAIAVDGGAAQSVPLQSCDRGGCYASGPLSDDAIASLLGGQVLNVVFQDLSKKTVKLPIPLAGFAAAYDRIK